MDLLAKDNSDRSVLHWSCYFGSENASLFCIAWGLDLNAQDKEVGMTPLHLAVSSGSVRIVQRLLKHGANKDITNLEGQTPHHMAK